jgi:hypothetical protein
MLYNINKLVECVTSYKNLWVPLQMVLVISCHHYITSNKKEWSLLQKINALLFRVHI